jgi:hypothetical protein
MTKIEYNKRKELIEKYGIAELDIEVGGNQIRISQLKDYLKVKQEIDEKNQRGFQTILGNENVPKRGLKIEIKL